MPIGSNKCTASIYILLPKVTDKVHHDLTLEKDTISLALAYDHKVLYFTPPEGGKEKAIMPKDVLQFKQKTVSPFSSIATSTRSRNHNAVCF
jgi:hypothetical protein